MPLHAHSHQHPTENISEIILSLVNNLDAMVAYWDTNQVCVFANDAYLLWFGKTGSEVIGMTLKELLGPLYVKNLPYILAAYEGHTQVFERTIPTPNRGIRHSLATYSPYIVDSQVRGIFVHVADVTTLKNLEHELQAAKAKAEELATHDFLTKLPNRVLLLDRIMQAIMQAKCTGQMVAVTSFDIDDFKKVNDTYGHGVGDQLLVEIATHMKHVLRKSDTVTRLGGDEFLLLAPGIESQEQIENIVNRMLESAKQPYRFEDATISPTFSAGIALYPMHGTTAELLIQNSDRALYIAKERGKDRYVFAREHEG